MCAVTAYPAIVRGTVRAEGSTMTNAIRNRNLRAAAATDSEWDSRLSDADRNAMSCSSGGTLDTFGPGGYEFEYLPADSYGSTLGSILCAECATSYLQDDAANAVMAACYINMDRPYGGEYCEDCNAAIITPYCAECGKDETELDDDTELTRPPNGDSHAPHYCTECLAEYVDVQALSREGSNHETNKGN